MKMVKSFNQREINTARSHPPSSLQISFIQQHGFWWKFEFVNFDEDFYGKLYTVNSYVQWTMSILDTKSVPIHQKARIQKSELQLQARSNLIYTNHSKKSCLTVKVYKLKAVTQKLHWNERWHFWNNHTCRNKYICTTFSCSISDIYLFYC